MKNNPNTPPAGLSEAACQWWQRLTAEYSIGDAAGKLLLESALRCFDRLQECQEAIAADGVSIKDKWGQTKAHPLLSAERDARSGMLSALKALNFDLEQVGNIGRPPRI